MKKLLIITLFLILSSFVIAEEQKIYNLTIQSENGVITNEGIFVAKSNYVEPLYNPPNSYKLELTSFSGTVLYTRNFEFDFLIQAEEDQDPLEGFEAPSQISDISRVNIVFPYFENGKTINIYNPEGTLELEIDVGYFADVCGNTACEPHESYQSCPSDCPSGGKDDYCDSIDDNICDPDCRPQTDLDCEQGQPGKPPETQKEETDLLTIGIAVIIIIAIAALAMKFKK